MPADAVPQDVLSVDGAYEELEHKFPMANTEEDAFGSPEDSPCFGFQVSSKVYYPPDSTRK